MIHLKIAARTHLGTVRAHNEDAFVIGDSAVAGTSDTRIERMVSIDSPLLLGVADGIGGHKAGGVASERATRRLAAGPFCAQQALEDVLRALDTELLEAGNAVQTFRLGTTFCGILFSPSPVGVVIGDGFIGMLSGRALRPFGLSWADIEQTSSLDAALGGRNPSIPFSLDWHNIPFDAGARYVIATDGVIRALDYNAFRSAISEGVTPTDCLDRIFSRALQTRAPDNLTCIIVEVCDAP